MIYIVYFEGRSGECDSQRVLSHVLLGRRDESKERPEERIFTTPSNELSVEDNEKLLIFMRNKTRFGRYDTHVLDWFESEEKARDDMPKWREWLEVRVVPVNIVIP